MIHILRQLLAFTLALLTLSPFLRRAYRRGELGLLGDWWRRASRRMRFLVLLLLFPISAYAVDKLLRLHLNEALADVSHAIAALCTNAFETIEQQTGYAITEARTNEIHDLTMPQNAQLADRIARRGAYDDGFWLFDACTNRLAREGLDLENPVWIQTEGTITVRSPSPGIPIEELSLYTTYSNITVYAPLQGSYGFLPGSRWPEFNVSRIWMAVTDRGTRVITWEGALRNRDPAQPVSFQAEFHENGDITYRYNPAQTNFAGIGLFRNGAALIFGLSDLPDFQDLAGLTTNPLPLTTLHLSYIGDLGDGSSDTDDDGLTDWEEVKRYHTDPHHPDTDLDCLADDEEVFLGSDPNSRDTDGDGIVDGSDPDPLAETPLDDFDGDGLPDAYEIHWFGGTNVHDSATERDGTGFSLEGKLFAGINPTNEVREAFIAATNTCVAWHLFDGFAMDLPEGMTNLVWERTFTVNRSSAWQQFFLSASPTNAAAWNLQNALLEWEADTGSSGSASSSPHGDSFRIPLATNDFPHSLTLRIRATGTSTVLSPNPIHLVAYTPEFRIEGGREVMGEGGAKLNVFLEGTASQILLAIDHSHRPCNAPLGADELDMLALEEMGGGGLHFYGEENGGAMTVDRPGTYVLPDFSLGIPASAGIRSPRRGASGGDTVIVLDPSVGWNCNGHGCGYDGLGYDWDWDWYYEEDYYPLDSKCLRKKWYHDWDGGWLHDNCELYVSSGVGDGGGHVTTSADGNTGKVYVDGVEVWSGTSEHIYDDAGCAGGYHENFLGDECDSCDDDCANGNCDSLEGPSLGSLKFRIPLGAPVKGQVAGFVWIASDTPMGISRSTFQLLEHPCATITDTYESGARRIVCHDSRGRDLRIENIANGARVTIRETASQKLEHTWEVVNVNGDPARIRLRKISRLNNVMSDETYTYADGDWTRFDNIAGVGTQLTVYDDFADYGDGTKYEIRTITDASGKTLSSVTTVTSRIGDCDNAVMRETYRYESTGRGFRWTQADYWDDPAHSARHGQPRLVYGTARAWVYTDFDDFGHEILRVEQRGNAYYPSYFPYVESGELCGISSLADAFVTVRDYEPHSDDSCHPDDAARPRTETRFVVTNGVATVVGRTWTRYIRLTRDGHDAIKTETWRATTPNASFFDVGNAYSYEIAYADTGDGTPLLMRNAVAESLDEDGIITVNTYALTNGLLVCESRRYAPSALAFPIYETTERDASYGTLLRSTVRLTDGDTIIADEQSVYDEKNRLRSTTYLNGTTITNAYSCCRLLWYQEGERRKVLRSAQTGTDHLYNAMEEVWLGDVSTNGQYRVTQHFYDAIGRETNTVVYAGATPGEATIASSSNGKAYTTVTTTYPYGGSDYAVSTDERGRVTIRCVDYEWDYVETVETVFTNNVEVLKTKSRAYVGGGSLMRREWGENWTEERRFTDYEADGRRIEYVVTESSDCGAVTNSVSTYDLLGRLVSSAVPGANGSAIISFHTYDGTSSRVLSTATTGSLPIFHSYNGRGERVGTAQGDISSWGETTYETIGQEVYRVETSWRMTGAITNSVQIRRTQLTGLTDALRSRTISIAADGTETVAEESFDAITGVTTTTTQTDGRIPVVTRSIHGLPISQATLDEERELSYDAYGRTVGVAVTDASTGATNRIESIEYDVSGNVACSMVDYGADGVSIATVEYDMLGRETSRTDALGNTIDTAYDPLGRPVATSGDAYPLLTAYDTQGRKIVSRTSRDDGATWDATQWEYDAASGLNMVKEYADGSRIAYAYTDNGKKTRTTWARGAWKENAYNERNLVSGTTYSGTATPSVAYAYADSGKMASATLSDGTVYAYAYDDSLLCTNETVHSASEDFRIERTYDGFRRAVETAVMITNVRHTAKVRLYDSENRVCGYALTNAAGRGVSVTFAYDGSFVTNATFVLPNGGIFSKRLTRKAGRKELVTRRDYAFGGQPAYWYATGYDLLGRPTNATDSASLAREWLYNRRSELSAASIGTNHYGYAYDTIGNRLWASANAATNTYSANCLNQYASILRTSVSPCERSYDLDGNLTNDGVYSYAYDAENRLVSVTSAGDTNGAIRILNAYDHRHRRIRKIVQRLSLSVSQPPAPPIETREWQTVATHSFVWDGNLPVHETVQRFNGSTVERSYFWGMDKSGTEQGAGGVGGLLAVSIDGAFFIPCYDHNGNIVSYISEVGSVVAQYTYDSYGNTIEDSGSLANQFSFGFSTKYHDRETDMIAYQRRFYSPDLGRWLNRDSIEEDGGENLYAFCLNSPQLYVDKNGNVLLIDSLIFTAVGGIVGGISAALSGGDVLAGAVGGAVSGLCISVCPGAAAGCGALGGFVSGVISGWRSANRRKLCGAKWRVHVAGTIIIETTSGALFGKVGGKLGDGVEIIERIMGSWTKTITKSSLKVTLEAVGANFATSVSCGVSSTAAETVMEAVEAAVEAITRIGEIEERSIEEIGVEAEATGTFK